MRHSTRKVLSLFTGVIGGLFASQFVAAALGVTAISTANALSPCENQACEIVSADIRWCFNTDLDAYCDAPDFDCTETRWCDEKVQ